MIFSSICYENDLDLSKLKVEVIPIFAITNTLWQAYLEYQIIWTQRIVIITKMATIDMHRLFLLSWPLTFDLDLQTFEKNSQQPFSKPTRQDEHFGI